MSWNSASAATPHLARLAEERGGVVLDSAYSLPVCSPARAALLTGHYPHTTAIQDSLPHFTLTVFCFWGLGASWCSQILELKSEISSPKIISKTCQCPLNVHELGSMSDC